MTPLNTRMPITIGGRDIDISQIGYCLQAELKEAFPINQVPEALVGHIDKLVETLERAEADIEHFILTVRRWKDHEDFMSA
jgi:hypothetical protein